MKKGTGGMSREASMQANKVSSISAMSIREICNGASENWPQFDKLDTPRSINIKSKGLQAFISKNDGR